MTRATVEHTDWGVWVDELKTTTSRVGLDWWTAYWCHFAHTPRMTCLAMTPQGGHWHVACDSEADAKWLAGHMVEHGGMHRTAVKVKRLALCKRVSAS